MAMLLDRATKAAALCAALIVNPAWISAGCSGGSSEKPAGAQFNFGEEDTLALVSQLQAQNTFAFDVYRVELELHQGTASANDESCGGDARSFVADAHACPDEPDTVVPLSGEVRLVDTSQDPEVERTTIAIEGNLVVRGLDLDNATVRMSDEANGELSSSLEISWDGNETFELEGFWALGAADDGSDVIHNFRP